MTIASTRARLRAAEQAYNNAEPGRNLTEARHELTCARAEYQAACVALVESLKDALEPFAMETREWSIKNPNDMRVHTGSNPDHSEPSEFNLGDLRRLSSIYKEITDEA